MFKMKNKTATCFVAFVFFAFFFFASYCYAEDCTVLGNTEYRVSGECDTESRKCCSSGWSAWTLGTPECLGTPCPETCEDGLYRTSAKFEEDGACCADACSIPELKNTCDCLTYAKGDGFCECWDSRRDVFDKIIDQLVSKLDPMRAEILRKQLNLQNLNLACRQCPSFSSANAEICCAGEEPPLKKDCRSFDPNATGGYLNRTGSCVIGAGWDASYSGTCTCRSRYEWNAERMYCENMEGRITKIWQNWHCVNPKILSGNLKVGDSCYPKGSICYITRNSVYVLVNCE